MSVRWNNMTAPEIAARMVVGIWYDTATINECVPASRPVIHRTLCKMGAERRRIGRQYQVSLTKELEVME